MGVVYYKSSTLSQSRETLKAAIWSTKSMMMRLLMPQRRRRQRMPPTERQLNLRLPRLWKKRKKRRQKNKENILAYYSTKIKIQTMVFFNSNTNYLQALKKKNPSLQKETSSKIPTSLGHISIEYLDDEITVFWAINKKKYIL